LPQRGPVTLSNLNPLASEGLRSHGSIFAQYIMRLLRRSFSMTWLLLFILGNIHMIESLHLALICDECLTWAYVYNVSAA